MAAYYALTDENGVLCVDQLPPDNDVAGLARAYREVIYFHHPEEV